MKRKQSAALLNWFSPGLPNKFVFQTAPLYRRCFFCLRKRRRGGDNSKEIPQVILHLSDLTEEQAELICGWKYEGEYGVYNTSWETVQKQKWAIADNEKREIQFKAVLDEQNALRGYFRLVEDESRVMIGLGLNPQDCSKGYGSELMKLILDE
jgi:RimJ/RimL family protein N-acetyltransferase